MSKIAFIYPGQGAQKAGMGADFYEKSETARAVFDQAGETLGLDMKALCFKDNEKLDLTEYTQAALVTTCLAMTRVVEGRGLTADITAGLSLGEYCAIAAAGGMEDMDAIRLVRRRGILMQNTVPAGEGGMCAVMGLDAVKIEEVLAKLAEGRTEDSYDAASKPGKTGGDPGETEACCGDSQEAAACGAGMESCAKESGIHAGDVTIANYNCPGQIVITGKIRAVEAASVKLKEAGAKRVIMLNVSGPFHSPMLVPAGEELAKELDTVGLHPLKIPYVTNVTAGKVEDIAETRALLTKQVSSSVRWMQSMEYMIQDGVDTFVEIGPGRTLAGFMKKINRDVKVYNIASWEDMEKVTEELRR